MKPLLLILSAVVLCGCRYEKKIVYQSSQESSALRQQRIEREWNIKCTNREIWKIMTDGEVFRIKYPSGNISYDDLATRQDAESEINRLIKFHKIELREWKEVQ